MNPDLIKAYNVVLKTQFWFDLVRKNRGHSKVLPHSPLLPFAIMKIGVVAKIRGGSLAVLKLRF